MPDKLNLMDTFPEIRLETVSSGTITLPDEIETDYAIVLFYRGHW